MTPAPPRSVLRATRCSTSCLCSSSASLYTSSITRKEITSKSVGRRGAAMRTRSAVCDQKRAVACRGDSGRGLVCRAR